MLISSAVAQEVSMDAGMVSGAQPEPSVLSGLAPLLFIFVIFYFLIIRPQSKKMKAHQEMLSAIAKGDTIITNGGIHGKVLKVNDNGTLNVRIATDVEVVVERSMVSNAEVKNAKKASDKSSEKTAPAKKAANKNSKKTAA